MICYLWWQNELLLHSSFYSLKWELTAETAPTNRQITQASNDIKSKKPTYQMPHTLKQRKISLFLNNQKVMEGGSIMLIA